MSDKILDPNICGWDTASYLIFSDNVFGNFIYYSHLFPPVLVLALAIFVFWHNPRKLTSQILLFIALCFTAWSLIDLVLWATEKTHYTMFFWSILIHFDLLLYVGSFYFIHAFVTGKLPSWWKTLIMALLFVPLILFAHTSLNLVAFDFTNCWREALEGPLWQYYVYNAELFIAAWILFFSINQIRKATDKVKRNEIILVSIGILAFLISFSFGNITGSIEVDWELGQYGLFGMPVFVGLLTYLIVRYETLDIKVLSTEALVVGLGILILSLMFVQKTEDVRIIAFGTLILTTVLGVLLIRSVRREVKQRKEIEKLAADLKKANARLKILDKMKSEFVSIASHQLRSPLTSIRGYASLLMEGTYGKLSQKATEAVERINDSSRYMALSIEDYLNVSRIEAGNMKYEFSDFNLKERTQRIVDEMRPAALKKGLLMTFKSDCDSDCYVHADDGKTRQAIMNLVDNAMKYTPKGSITVIAHDDIKKKKMYVTVKDTGVGMNKEALGDVFDKFIRAKNANEVNVTGTGLGLFVAKKMIEEMKGKIWAESEGEGKGSSFHIELPLVNPKKSSR